jgi:phospholipase C
MNARRFLLAALSLVAAACDPQKSDWGLDAIRTMVTPPDDPTLECGAQIPADPAAAARAACQFTAGARAPASLGIDESVRAQIPIRHVVIVMKENRSFDHLLGHLHDLGRPDVEAVPPTYANPDLQGNAVFPSHATTTCIVHDPGHQAASVLNSINDGTMDGFVINAAETTGTDGHFAMWEYDQTDFPFYYWLASEFALADHHFAPMASGTFGNRNFLLFGTNAGVVDTGIAFPPPNTPSIMQLLMNQGFTWGAYSDGDPASGALDWGPSDPGVHSLQDFYDALDAGTLPNLSMVDGRDYIDDEHPFADIQTGEAWTKAIYDHVIASPQWPLMAVIWTYDEAGGFADHVPPPRGCQALPSKAPFTQMGPRIPLVAISPWAKRHFTSHIARDHTAILRFVETVFDLPALTARDANSDALFDLFDFSCGRDLSVPAAPAAGTNGCPEPPPLGAH